MHDGRNTHEEFWFGKPGGKKSLGRPSNKSEYVKITKFVLERNAAKASEQVLTICIYLLPPFLESIL
jgi:hypothetical protein